MLDKYSDHGLTALHMAEIHMHKEMADVLLSAGAKVMPMLPCLVDDCDNKCRVPHNCSEIHGG